MRAVDRPRRQVYHRSSNGAQPGEHDRMPDDSLQLRSRLDFLTTPSMRSKAGRRCRRIWTRCSAGSHRASRQLRIPAATMIARSRTCARKCTIWSARGQCSPAPSQQATCASWARNTHCTAARSHCWTRDSTSSSLLRLGFTQAARRRAGRVAASIRRRGGSARCTANRAFHGVSPRRRGGVSALAGRIRAERVTHGAGARMVGLALSGIVFAFVMLLVVLYRRPDR
jgi:hypothetical protein